MEIISGEDPSKNDNSFHENENQHFKPWGIELNQYCMLMHLSQFTGFFLLPVIMWAVHRKESELINQHGKNILNWSISLLIYAFIGMLLTFIIIGIPLLILVGACSLLFTIVAAIKATNGEVFKYPFAFEFFK